MDRLISEKSVMEVIYGCDWFIDEEHTEVIKERIKAIPSAEPQVEQWKDFVLWVAEEIFDENWEYNKGAFEELACRKLAKMGIVKANGDKWELVEPMESEE